MTASEIIFDGILVSKIQLVSPIICSLCIIELKQISFIYNLCLNKFFFLKCLFENNWYETKKWNEMKRRIYIILLQRICVITND